MATKIVQIDLTQPIAPVDGLDGFAHVWILVRYGGRPLGWVQFARTLAGERVMPEQIRSLVVQRLGPAVWEALVNGPPVKPAHRPPMSVIVCTRDHPDQLQRQLASLAKLDHPQWEVVVVDNAPTTDRTRQVCDQFPFVRYVLERRPGLDYARNTGWRSARHDIVAYTDDDAVVEPGWLTALGGPFEDPRVWCTTGVTFPLELATDAQECFELYGGFCRGFRRKVYRPGPWSRGVPLGSGQFGSGVNMALRKGFLERVGGFDDALDTGSLARGGGDLDIFARTLRHGGTLVYEPQAVVWHEHRRTMRQLKRQMFDYGYGFYAYLTKYDGDPQLARYAADLKRFWVRFWGWQRLRRNFKLMLKGKPYFPLNLILREMVGMLFGPRAYARSVEAVRQRAQQQGATEAA